jgi:hypothetical protein
VAEKQDAAFIRSYLQERDAQLAEARAIPRWWPRYAYHFTDVQNAARIIASGVLYSRKLAVDLALMVVENADTTVIARSPELTERSARFYFRPKTPTQYHNEGVRPVGSRTRHDAHCPVPVFFLFPLPDVLAREGVVFTDTAAYWTEVQIGQTIEDLRRLRWEDIYSDGPMPQSRRNELTGYRRAEILVPNSLEIDGVHRILCRTPAERETLLFLLDRDQRAAWRPRIEIAGAQVRWLFQAEWVYVESVQWTDTGLLFKFNPRAVVLPFRIEIRSFETDELLYDREGNLEFSYRNSQFQVPLASRNRRVRVRVTLDGCLAYGATLNRLEILRQP